MLYSMLTSLLLALNVGAPPTTPPLHFVQHLLRVPRSPGGLVPYRRGELWGYADTLGHVVIAPMLTAAPPFSPAGFVRLDAYYPPLHQGGKLDAHEPNDDDAFSADVAAAQVRLFANARGEFMLVHPNEVALLQPDSSLLLCPRYLVTNAGQQEVQDVSPEAGLVEKLRWQLVSMGKTQPLTTYRLETATLERRRARGYLTSLQSGAGPERFSYSATRRWPGFIKRTTRGRDGMFHTERKLQAHWIETNSARALLDERGHRLTPYRYAQIGDFSASGVAVVQARGSKRKAGGFGLFDQQGHPVLPLQYDGVWPGRTGGAVVCEATPRPGQEAAVTRSGIVDEQGHWLLPLQADLLSVPDEADLVRRRRVRAATDTVVEYLTIRGQLAFPTLPALREASKFQQGKAWARTEAGLGLLDTHGHWVVPPGRYEQLQPMESSATGLGIYLPADPLFARHQPQEIQLARGTAADYHRVDTTYLLARRAGRYGIVRRADGQEVVPCRYDNINAWVGEYGGGTRQHQAYLLAARGGRELAAGRYSGEWYDLPGRGLLFQLDISPYRWLVADTSGHPVTALLPQEGGYESFLTPENLVLLSRTPDHHNPAETQWGYHCQAIADTAGRLLVPYSAEIEYSGKPSWLNTSYYWGSVTERPLVPSHAFIVQQPDGQHLLLAHAGQVRDATGYAYQGLRLLAGGWHLGRRAGRSVLLSPQGAEVRAPEGYQWDEMLHQVGRLVPFANGTASVAESGFHKPVLHGKGGLITRGGRQLWEE